MSLQPLVSIVIPTYNRAHLIGETLDSIIEQTYKNWECIIVDDGSTDETDSVMDYYCLKEQRFHYDKRPSHKLQGGNACRNLGLKLAKGDYIVFFDSDDLMTEDHLEVKMNALSGSGLDYVFTRTKYFNVDDNSLDRYYKFDQYPLTAFNYIAQNINWLTYDICLQSKLAKSISFNEKLRSGQEYNYFSKLVLKSVNAQFVDKTVTLHRYHSNSIQTNLINAGLKPKRSFLSSWLTYKDLKRTASPLIRKSILYKCMRIQWREKRFVTTERLPFYFAILREFKGYLFYYLMMIFFRFYFNQGYSFRERLKIKSGMN